MKEKKLKLKPRVKLILTIILSFIIVLSIGLLVFGFDLTKKDKVKDNETTTIKKDEFKILAVNNNYNIYTIKFENVKDANKYLVDIVNKDNVKIITKDTENNTIDIEVPLDNLAYNDEYNIQVSAYKDDEVLKRTLSSKTIKWEYPSINAPVKSLNNKEYNLNILGNLTSDNKLLILDGVNELYNQTISSNDIPIPYNLYKNKNITLKVKLFDKDRLISSCELNNEYIVTKPVTTKAKNPISDISITNPAKYTYSKTIGDIELIYDGGEGSNSINIKIYENNNLIKNETLSEKKYVIPSSTFKPESGYRIIVEGINGNFTKSDSVYISTITDGRKKMVNLAQSQMGIYNGEKFWRWWGYTYRVEWCAIFVSWCADQLGYLDAGIIPKFQGVGSGVKWFKERGQFENGHSTYIPKPGDIIFYNYNNNASIDHVGIVKATDGEYVYTLEGNTGAKPGTSAEKKRRLNDPVIYGYGVPNY